MERARISLPGVTAPVSPDPATTRATDRRRDCPYNGQPPVQSRVALSRAAKDLATTLAPMNRTDRIRLMEQSMARAGGTLPRALKNVQTAAFEIQLHGIPAIGHGIDAAIDNWIAKAEAGSPYPAEPATASSAATAGG